jgi:hypothetical protein
LRVRKLQCQTMTQNRQNFMGIPLETDPDSIDISTIAVDAEQGVVVNSPIVFLGNRYTAGKIESFEPPKVISEFPISDADLFPRRLKVSLNMAEKDNGGGFDTLMTELSETVAREIREEVEGSSSSGRSSEDEWWKAVARVLEVIGKKIGKALGLGDDPFRPVELNQELRSFTDSIPAEQKTVEFLEPNPAHKGKFILTYDWFLSTSRSINDSASVGASAAPLTKRDATTRAVVGSYPRPYRIYRFRPPRSRKPLWPKAPIHAPSSWVNLLGAGRSGA